DLTLNGVRSCVFAFAAAATVIGDNGELRGEQLRERCARAHRAIAKRTIDQDQRRPPTAPLEGDRCAVRGADGLDRPRSRDCRGARLIHGAVHGMAHGWHCLFGETRLVSTMTATMKSSKAASFMSRTRPYSTIRKLYCPVP